MRPTADARVSAPLTWDEIDACEPADFTLATMPQRFAEVGDRHAGIDSSIRARSTGAARAVGAAGARGPGRRAVAAALQKQPGEPAARAAVAPAHPETPADRDRTRAEKEDALAGLERWKAAPSRGGRASRRRPTCSSTRCAAGFAPGRASA